VTFQGNSEIWSHKTGGILYASGGITDSASLAKYIHAEADTSVATNVKLYIKTQGDIGGTVP
jgi:hypothetical protein